MQVISQRLTRLFQIILDKGKPVSIGELSSLLGVSRRTVFRELENVDSVLKKYDLTLETSIKEGLFLKGEKENIDTFSREIFNTNGISSVNKDERRKALAFALLDSTDWQKLYYYSSMLEVSEATISLDLDILQEEFAGFNLVIQRKKGVGVLVEGLERNIRSALVSYMSKDSHNIESLSVKYDFPPAYIEEEVKNVISLLSMQLDWITSDTIKLIEYRLCVQVSRIKKAAIINEESDIPFNSLLWQLAKRIADEIENRFAIEIPKSEVMMIATDLRSARAKQKNPISEDEEIANFNKVKSLAFLIVEKFDSRIAPILKNNEEFIRGITIHLWSAIERLKSGYVIKDPLDGQVKKNYPDIYNRTKNATKILEEEFSRSVPEGEVACLATHFGAAVMQIGQDKLKRRLKVGIVCIGGIGVSYMLNSQVKKRFSNEVITEISEYNNKEQWEKNDFIISTIPLQSDEKIVINVNPILSTKDYENIRDTIETLRSNNYEIKSSNSENFISQIEKTRLLLKEVQSILTNFKKIEVDEGESVKHLAKVAGYHFGYSAENGEKIYNALVKREEISTQLISELELVLLHCVSDGVDQPTVALLSPQGKKIVNANGDEAKSCLTILLPKNSSEELREAIGLVSANLIEDEDFLSEVIKENESGIYSKLEEILHQHLTTYLGKTFK